MGYDIGNVVANLIFAYDNGVAAGDTAFCDWALQAIVDTINLFCEKFLTVFDECVTDLMAKTKGFKQWYLNSILADTAAYAGTELIRRTVGMAQVKDVTTIADEDKRAFAERVNILCAKDYIMHPATPAARCLPPTPCKSKRTDATCLPGNSPYSQCNNKYLREYTL